MKARATLAWTAFLLLAGAGPARANPHPGSIAFESFLVMPLAIVVLTAIGGGYAVKKRLRAARASTALLFLNLTASILSAILIVGSPNINMWYWLRTAVPLLGLAGIYRGVVMLVWGFRVRRGVSVPEHLSGAKSWRLIPAGTALVVCTAFLAGAVWAFPSYEPRTRKRVEEKVIRVTTMLMADMRLEGERTGANRLPRRDDWQNYLADNGGAFKGMKFSVSDEGRRFTLLVPPAASAGGFWGPGPFPFFPYNQFVSFPAYRADETGRIRMVLAHHEDTVCPEDAPVVYQVGEEEVQRWVVSLREEERRSKEEAAREAAGKAEAKRP